MVNNGVKALNRYHSALTQSQNMPKDENGFFLRPLLHPFFKFPKCLKMMPVGLDEAGAGCTND